MRVLFVSGLTGFASGGVNTEMCRLIGGMRDRGIETAFAIDRLPASLENIQHFPIHYPPGKDVGEKIRSAVKEFKPDCVHLVGGGLSVLRPMDAMALEIPWIFTAHNLPPFEQINSSFTGHNRLYYLARDARALPTTLLWKHLLRRGTFSKVIAHSQTVARHLVDYGCRADKVVMIPFGCEAPESIANPILNPFPADAFPKILTVAGYAHHKGIHDYISAAGQLIAHFPKLAYIVIGNSRNQRYTQFLQQRIDQLKLSSHVILQRNASDELKHAALAAADLYVQPSHEEGFCLAFAEAAMVAPRLLGCRTGEMAGLAGNAPSAQIVASKQVNSLVTATRQLMSMQVTTEQIASRVRHLQERYSWATYLDQHQALFSSDRR